MVSALISRCLLLILGTLYPAYRSYKAIKNKDVREHVKWMMYWIVFALFTTLETFLDIFFSWFPFYYEIKILFILWVLSPATRGSSLLYKKVVHPMLNSREKEIDELIEKTKQQGYTTFLNLFTSGFQYASTLFMSSALKGQLLLGHQLKKSLSMNDVYQEQEVNRKSKPSPPETISENGGEEDSSDYEQEVLNNPAVERLRRQPSTSSGSRKQSINRDFEFIDDNMWMPDEAESRKQSTATLTSAGGSTRRKASTNTTSSTSTTSSSRQNGHRANEMSHFGTVTRAKSGSRTRLNPTAPSNYDNDY